MQHRAPFQRARVAVALLLSVLLLLSTTREAMPQEASTSDAPVVEMVPPGDATPAGQVTLAFDRALIAGVDPDALAGRDSYAFQLDGVDLASLSSDQWAELCQCPPGSMWGASPQHAFIVGLDQNTPVGIYQVVLQLPDGRTAQASLVQAAPPAAIIPTLTPTQVPPGSVAYRFDNSTSAEDRQLIREGIELANRYFVNAFGRTVGRLVTVETLPSDSSSGIAEAQFNFTITINTNPDWRQTTPNGKRKIVAHEYFHLLQYELTGSFPDFHERVGPDWLFEGAAEWVGHNAVINGGLVTLANVADCETSLVLHGGLLPPLSTLEPVPAFQQARGAVYALAFLAVRSLTASSGIRSLATYFGQATRAVDWHDAFTTSFAQDAPTFYRQFERERSAYKDPVGQPCK